MSNIPAEIIKQYRVRVEGLDFTVYGRIIKSVKGEDEESYLGELSHYCKQSKDDLGAYKPSLVRREIEQVESLIIQYLEKFTNINVEKNNYY
jgi:hypothetical protein